MIDEKNSRPCCKFTAFVKNHDRRRKSRKSRRPWLGEFLGTLNIAYVIPCCQKRKMSSLGHHARCTRHTLYRQKVFKSTKTCIFTRRQNQDYCDVYIECHKSTGTLSVARSARNRFSACTYIAPIVLNPGAQFGIRNGLCVHARRDNPWTVVTSTMIVKTRL